MLSRRHLLASAATGLVAAAMPGLAHAQLLDGTSRVVVGFPAGGPTDVVARLLTEQLRTSYASKIVVENRPGAAGRLGIDNVKTAAPDGLTLLFTPGSLLTIYPHVYKNLKYDPVRDLTPVAIAGVMGFALSVGPMVPKSVTNLADFVAWCKANPAKAQFASPAAGAAPHFVGAMFAKAANLDFQHVAYRGSAPVIQDLIGGQLASASTTIYDTLSQIQDGNLRVLATSGAKRSSFLPNVPTFVEQGYPGFEAADWFGIFLPPKASPEIVAKLAAALKAASATPVIQQRLKELAFEPLDITPEQLGARLKADIEQWGPVVKATGFTLDD